jgi:hypothetical protein
VALASPTLPVLEAVAFATVSIMLNSSAIEAAPTVPSAVGTKLCPTTKSPINKTDLDKTKRFTILPPKIKS